MRSTPSSGRTVPWLTHRRQRAYFRRSFSVSHSSARQNPGHTWFLQLWHTTRRQPGFLPQPQGHQQRYLFFFGMTACAKCAEGSRQEMLRGTSCITFATWACYGRIDKYCLLTCASWACSGTVVKICSTQHQIQNKSLGRA